MSKFFAVRLFGSLSIQCDGRTILTGESGRVHEALAYLLLFRDRPHSREALVEKLWPDGLSEQPRKQFRQVLWKLRSALDELGVDQEFLLIRPESVQVRSGAGLWLDVAEFEQVSRLTRSVPAAELEDKHLQALREAVALYRGALLEGWYQDWSLGERERLQNVFLIMLDKLMAHAELTGDYEVAIAYGEQSLAHEPVRERTHRSLMRAHYLAGDRTTALQQYLRCATLLDKELGVEPSPRTVELYQQIRAGHLVEQSAPARASEAPAVTAQQALDESLRRLIEMQSSLKSLQEKVGQEIRTIQQVLRPWPADRQPRPHATPRVARLERIR